MPSAWHVVFRRRDNRVLATTRGQRLHIIRTFARFCADHDLLAFCLADTHAHAVLADERGPVGRLCQRIGSSLQQTCRFGSPFGPSRVVRIERQAHLRNAVTYTWRQLEHHGLAPDPLAECSNLLDVLGARVLFAGSGRALARHLPRLRPTEHAPAGWRCRPGPDWAQLESAAAVAVGRTSIRGRGDAAVAARTAAVALAPAGGLPRRVALRFLTRSAVHRLARQPVDPGLVGAIELAVRLPSLPAAGK